MSLAFGFLAALSNDCLLLADDPMAMATRSISDFPLAAISASKSPHLPVMIDDFVEGRAGRGKCAS
jgi:hypothetical protein